jgi:hypothetical protein
MPEAAADLPTRATRRRAGSTPVHEEAVMIRRAVLGFFMVAAMVVALGLLAWVEAEMSMRHESVD